MIIGTICVHGVRALPVSVKPIPRGIIGAKVQFEYADPMWDGLSKTVVFQAGDVTKDVLNAGELVNVPPEVVAEVGEILKVGVYGEGIPTLWADLGRIRDATDPSGDESTDPSLPVWEQLQEQIDDLKKAGVSEEKIAQIVSEYLQKNPPTVTETDPTVPNWAKNEKKPTYTADEVGALSKTELSGAVNDALAQAKASGEFKGDPGQPGKDGADGVDGNPGADGITPHIGSNGNWFIGNADTGKPSRGADGRPGNDGQDYVLTPDDKTEIAELAAELVEVPDSGGNVDLGVTGATVGQTVKISAVDANGVPTAWEPMDVSYTKSEIDAIMGSYVTDIDNLVGGDV